MALYAAGIIFFSLLLHRGGVQSRGDGREPKRNGGFIPGIRPGKNTAIYLDYVLTRITVIGAIYLDADLPACPNTWSRRRGIQLFLGGTSLLIVVNVTMDTMTRSSPICSRTNMAT